VSLTGKDIAEIARLLDASHFTSLDLEQGEFRLRIRRDGAGNVDGNDDGNSDGIGDSWADDYGDEEQDDAPAQAPSDSAAPAPAAAPAGGPGKGEVDILAPLIGNFYTSPRPGEPPFVNVGDRISEDSAVAIIEVMKLMNSVRSGIAGTVIAVLAENGSAVEEGQPLIRVKAD